MAAINDLLVQVKDEALRNRLEEEVKKLYKQKKFGLVFEEHLPECTPLYGIAIKSGIKVARSNAMKDVYTVIKVSGDNVICAKKNSEEAEIISAAELVPVAEFGDPIFPCLQPIDFVCNASNNDLWHTLIEADNYHALQLLEYLYAGKVDCIYIDPPYNTGAKDWKYNNDYVDINDSYRHSKWLSMMQKRLKLAKKLLNPKDSVLIITIDEKEYHHLACLLEEIFSEARIQMIDSVINPKGTPGVDQFMRMDEYIFFIQLGTAFPQKLPLHDDFRINSSDKRVKKLLRWQGLAKTQYSRDGHPDTFYPIFISEDYSKIIEIGDPIGKGIDRHTVPNRKGCITVWPINKSSGKEAQWSITAPKLRKNLSKGYVKVTQTGTIYYLTSGVIDQIENGDFTIIGYNNDGSIILDESEYEYKFVPGTAWKITSHDATRYGSDMLRKIIPDRKFPFPKSLYAVHDTIRFFVANKPDALIVDFFAGSGTTLHAVNLLNAEDGGKRRCIMVTNNEVSDAEAKEMKIKGLNPGDEEWEKLGIARYVTWPRTVCSIEGHDVNGNPLKGNYIGSDIPMADGFKANAAFFKLGFLDKNAVALGRQFKEMLPILWMKAGTKGKCPVLKNYDLPGYMILPENKFAVLIDEKTFADFESKVLANRDIETVYIITDSEFGYKSMISRLRDRNTYQLYRDYLDNFRINIAR